MIKHEICVIIINDRTKTIAILSLAPPTYEKQLACEGVHIT